MKRLVPVIFNDAWGSTVSLASLRGLPIPSALPESELWMGAHEAGPSPLRDGQGTLLDLISADPAAALGADAVARFGPRLPFLLKVLAPGRAISIQAHPTAEQAASERSRSGDSVYGDEWAKPELLLAIAPFEIFIGMRPHAEIAAFAQRLGVPRLIDAVAASSTAAGPTHDLLARLLGVVGEEAVSLVRQVVAGAIRVERTEDEFGEAAAAIVRIAEEHPDDIGIVVLVLMRHQLLQPGEFVDVAAGVLHSYVRGLGIEVLANSDNVVRAGLTAKEVNTAELLRIVDSAATGIVGRPVVVGPGLEYFPSASDRFRLHRVEPAGCALLPGDGSPRVVFALRGPVRLGRGEAVIELADADSVFLPALARNVPVAGSGELYVVSVPDA